MRFRNMLCILAAAILLGAVSTAQADVPQSINYQGILLTAGVPVTVPTDVTFSIHDQLIGGNQKWSQQRTVSPDAQGLFSIILGEINNITDAVFDGPDRWLQLQVVGDSAMTPRAQIVTSGYAFRVSTVDGSSGGIISGDVSIQSDLAVSGKATIGPGHTNTGPYAFVAGQNNSATSDWATVSGGVLNTASGWKSTVSGGAENEATLHYAVVSGGYSNAANGIGNTISGGQQNATSSTNSTVGGGALNVASGLYSTVPGGYYNYAVGQYAFAAGRKAKANHDGAFVWADHTDADFASTGADQFLIRADGGVGIGTTSPQETLDVNGSVQMQGFKMPGGQVGDVLTSDASGVGTWQPGATVTPQDVFRYFRSYTLFGQPQIAIPADAYTHIITGICIAKPTDAFFNLQFFTSGGNVINLASSTGGVSWSSGGGAPIVIQAGDQLTVGNIWGLVDITITGYHQ